MRARSTLLATLMFPLLAGCTTATRDDAVRERIVYVAIGASDTVGVGAEDPRADAWPSVFSRIALPQNAEYHNLGISGATTQEALRSQLPKAERLRPTIVTIWLNVNDLTHGVMPDVYEERLLRLLTSLREVGAQQILVANTPVLEDLPAYRSCLEPGAVDVTCRFPGFVPPPELVRFAVDAYNEAIERAAEAAGAIVVDLHALGSAPASHPDWVSADGFHPSSEGYRVVAERFADALGDAAADAA
jgi:lysophospholipase L1-like esterase